MVSCKTAVDNVRRIGLLEISWIIILVWLLAFHRYQPWGIPGIMPSFLSPFGVIAPGKLSNSYSLACSPAFYLHQNSCWIFRVISHYFAYFVLISSLHSSMEYFKRLLYQIEKLFHLPLFQSSCFFLLILL